MKLWSERGKDGVHFSYCVLIHHPTEYFSMPTFNLFTRKLFFFFTFMPNVNIIKECVDVYVAC